jgi:hypothetical protein
LHEVPPVNVSRADAANAALPRNASLTINRWMKAPAPGVWLMNLDAKSTRRGKEIMKRCYSWTVVRFVTYACGVVAATGCAANGKSPSSFVAMQGSTVESCCATNHWIIFFDGRNSGITPEGEKILVNVLSDYRRSHSTAMKLVGYTDRSGSGAHNLVLSQRRADAVKDWMVAHGIPAAVITTEALVESSPLVETIDGVREPQSHRVEIGFNEAR